MFWLLCCHGGDGVTMKLRRQFHDRAVPYCQLDGIVSYQSMRTVGPGPGPNSKVFPIIPIYSKSLNS